MRPSTMVIRVLRIMRLENHRSDIRRRILLSRHRSGQNQAFREPAPPLTPVLDRIRIAAQDQMAYHE
jgi:hypothetical protein